MELYDPDPALRLTRRHESVEYPFACVFGEADLLIEQGVFCPTLTRTSPFLLRNIDVRVGDRMLDLFSGSGAFGVVGALRGAHVVTVDASPLATACAVGNARRNGVADSMEVRLGNLVAAHDEVERSAERSAEHGHMASGPAVCDGSADGTGVRPGEEFDLIIANPPLLPGEPTGPLSCALLDPGLAATTGCIKVMARTLALEGRAYLLTSDVLERFGLSVEKLCQDAGLTATPHGNEDCGYETYRIHLIRRSTAPGDDQERRC